MKPLTAALLAMVMIVVAVVIVAVDFGDDERIYDIEYNLDGGINGDNPATYTSKDEFVFEPAVRDGHIFSGWFSDSAHTVPMTGVSKGTKGDLNMYAAWTANLVGTGYKMELTGTYKDTPAPANGTYEFRFLAVDGDNHFQEMRTDVRYGASGYSYDDFYWSADETKLWTPDGKEIIVTKDGEMVCDVLKYGDKTRWKSGEIIYKETCESNRMDYVCLLTSTFTFETDPEHTVTALGSEGISGYIGPGTYATGSDVTLKPIVSEGYRINGWYSGDSLVSMSPDYRIHGLHGDVSLRAVAVKDATTYWMVGEEVHLSDGTGNEGTVWMVADKYDETLIVELEGEDPVFTFIEPGRYVIHNSTTGKSREVVVDGDVSHPVTWYLKYQGNGDAYSVRHSFDIEWTIPYSHYSLYREMDSTRNHVSETVDSRFITWMDSDIAYLSALLEQEAAENAPDKIDDTVWMANYVLAFVQYAVDYEYDKDAHGADEYWKYPIETLFDCKGDCEDSALLFVALTSHMGLDSVLILYLPTIGNGHAFSGIAVDASGSYYDINGKKMYYCESTGHGHAVGKLPNGGERYRATSVSYPHRD